MPRHYHVIIQPRASRDIIGICTYIEQHSPQNAASVAQRLLNAIDSLEFLPHRYKVHGSRRSPGQSVRSMPVSSFIIYYRVLETRETVEILAVLHGARKQPRHFA
jgi:toxin ParE1/3/4